MEASEVVAGPDGAVWYADGRYLGRIAPDGTYMQFDFASEGVTEVRHPVVAADGDLWWIGNGVARFLNTGSLTRFVRNDFIDVLGRDPDASSLAFWTGRFLIQGGFNDTGQLTVQLLASIEWREHAVDDLFLTLLGRSVDPAGRQFWSSRLADGYRLEDLRALIIGSDEYFEGRGGGTNESYVTTVYRDLLHRDPEPAGLAYWLERLDEPGPRGVVASSLVYTNEAFRVLVQQIYAQYLERATDAAGETYWADQLGHGTTDQQLIVLITASEEYYLKPLQSP
jgi:hypothetical protein